VEEGGVSFGKMATLLFGVAGLLALVSFSVLPAAPSRFDSGHGVEGEGHVVAPHVPGEDPAENANRRLAESRAQHAAVPLDFGAAPGTADLNAAPADGSGSDELPGAGQERVPQQAAALSQPAAPRAPQIQAAPQASFVPGQPMMDTNPSR
jgi:hypothetical protein